MLHNQNGQSMYNRQSLQPEKEYGYPGVSGQHVYGASNSNVTDTYPQGHPNSSFQPPPNYYSGNQGQTFQPQSQPPYYSAQSIQSVNQPPLPPMPPIPNHQDFVQRPQQPRLPSMPPMPPGHEGVPPPSYRQPQPPGPFPLPNGANTQINTLHSQQAYQNGPVSRQPQFSQSINADRLPSPIEVFRFHSFCFIIISKSHGLTCLLCLMYHQHLDNFPFIVVIYIAKGGDPGANLHGNVILEFSFIIA